MAVNTEVDGTVRFGSFELDVRSRELREGARRVRLQEQPFEILQMMLERRGQVVTRDELRERLWPAGTFVDFEHSLNAAVKRLRAALGDDADSPRFVETLPRRGYRFIGDIDEGPAPAGMPETPRVRLAVLPFAELSDGEFDHFSDGLTDEMISQLGRLFRGRIGVVSSHSSMAFKGSSSSAREIGVALRADYLLEGSVRREGERVRVAARLVASAADAHLWADTYERHLTDCLSVQTEVAARIARSLAMELLPEQRTSMRPARDAAAYQAYVKGRYHWQRTADTGAEQALVFFEEAIDRDPSFAPAWAGLATVHVLRAEHYHEPPRQALEKARGAAERSLQLDSALAAGHQALGDVRRLLLWDLGGARDAYVQAIALNPSFEGARASYAKLLATLGRFAAAIREADMGRELDPRCLTMNTVAAWARYVAGDIDTAVELCRHNLEMDETYADARRLLGAALLAAGRRKEALRVLEGAVEAHRDPVSVAWLAHARAATGDAGLARDLLASLERPSGDHYVPAFHLALVHVGLGDLDRAFAALGRASDDREPSVANMAIDPRFAPLRADPRYRDCAARLGV
jgi:TolB-like protein/Flp pilus assembly protein TadD